MTELEKCKKDTKYFIEKYCTINGEHIRLKDYQIKFLSYLKNQKYGNSNKRR